MAVTPAAVRTAAVRTATAGAHRHWLLNPIGCNVNQCSFAPQSSTAYRHGVPRQRIDLTSHCPSTVRRDLRGEGGILPCTGRWLTCRQWKNAI
ncbi:hypothetical protein NDU88_004631 [Pleurodeles waltl]|uniref:Secreted protein n=1 Tax=Pleurodeles waltl TaxID=8319 RepID=A0AAV7SJI6_PLEWA|nr:hypothetical protein NDU88_004631 [Pleurodeles waltl]